MCRIDFPKFTRTNFTVTSSIAFFCVAEPPSAPVITGLNRTGHTLREGESVSLTCASVDGSPPPELAWYRGDQRADSLPGVSLSAAGTPAGDTNDQQTSSLKIDFIASREDNDLPYR